MAAAAFCSRTHPTWPRTALPSPISSAIARGLLIGIAAKDKVAAHFLGPHSLIAYFGLPQRLL